jgi:two-component system, sensor histidine kinase and response regulator
VVVSAAGLMQEKGSGIGLKLCKDFVEVNGGKIWAESEAGVGTCFFFTVPVGEEVEEVVY